MSSPSLNGSPLVSQWLRFEAPGRVVVSSGKVEIGQGILTALAQIAADALALPLDAIAMQPACTGSSPDEGVTSGSFSVQHSGTAIRLACTAARAIAMQAAAACAGVAVDALQWRDGTAIAPDGRVLGDYWSLLDASALDVAVPKEGAAPPWPQRRWVGESVARRDLPGKVFGAPAFIHDLVLPDMLHGRVLRSRTPGARLLDLDDGAARALPGVVCTVRDGHFVGVVATGEAAADAALDALAAATRWSPAPALPAADALETFLRDAPSVVSVLADVGGEATAAAAATSTTRRLRATYLKPYIAHASLAPSCAIARFTDGGLEVWSHSQGIYNLRKDIAVALAGEPQPLPIERIVVHHVEGAGCYGHNPADDVAFDAVLLAHAVPGRPVRVRNSRADELANGPFGPAHLVDLEAALDDDGRIAEWHAQVRSNGYSTRPGRAAIPTLLGASQRAGAPPMPIAINVPLAAGGGTERNAVPAYRIGRLHVASHCVQAMPLRTSAIRSLGAFANVFANESFVDELALAAGADPLAFRLAHVDEPRAWAVLQAAIDAATWWRTRGAAPAGGVAHGDGAARVDAARDDAIRDDAVGQGLAWARYKGNGAWCAVALQVRVGAELRVERVVAAVDVGLVVNPDGVRNQIEGGLVQGLSWALKEAVTWDGATLTSVDWERYPILRFSEVPEIDVVLLERPDQPSVGAGEAAQGPVAAALGNAVADALGVRVRRLPLTPDAIRQAIDTQFSA